MSPEFTEQFEAHLRSKLIPFWSRLRDEEFGGYFGKVGFDLTCYKKATKNTVQTSRILYFFSESALMLDDEECRKNADHAYTFLESHGIDSEYGGLFWSLTFSGEVEDPIKSSFAFAYGILALVSYYRLTKKEVALEHARNLYRLIELHFADTIGYREVLSSDFQSNPYEIHRFSKGEYSGEKTMNTLLHLLEAYHSLYLVDPSEELLGRIRSIQTLFLTHIRRSDKKGLAMYFDSSMNQASDYRSYGHEIEASWMVANSLCGLPSHEDDQSILSLCDELAADVYNEAFVADSLMDEIHSPKVRRRRGHWIQAEAVMGFCHAYGRNTHLTHYRDAVQTIWDFIQKHLVDKRENGEWFYVVDQDGTITEPHAVVWPWKGPYNNGRMCLTLMSNQYGI